MKIVKLRWTSDLTIEVDTQYNDIASKNVTVQRNVTTRIYGVISKTLLVEKGATVYLHGPKPEQIINEGGLVFVYDPASGEVITY